MLINLSDDPKKNKIHNCFCGLTLHLSQKDSSKNTRSTIFFLSYIIAKAFIQQPQSCPDRTKEKKKTFLC